MSVQTIKGKFPHVHWLDLNEDGTLVECAVLRQDQLNNIYYIQIDKLDSVDKGRLVKILSGRQVENLELWDAMSSVTLGNGMNALKYFHQLVKVITNSGTVMKPQLGKLGVTLVNTESNKTPTPEQLSAAQEVVEAGNDANIKAAPKKRGRKAKTSA